MSCLLEQYTYAHADEHVPIPMVTFNEELAIVPSVVFDNFRTNFKRLRRGRYKPGTSIPLNKISNACLIARRACGHCVMCDKKTLKHFEGYEQHINMIHHGKDRGEYVYLLMPNYSFSCSSEDEIAFVQQYRALKMPSYDILVHDSHLVLPRHDGQIFYVPLQNIHENDVDFLMKSNMRNKLMQYDPVMLRIQDIDSESDISDDDTLEGQEDDSESDLSITASDYEDL